MDRFVDFLWVGAGGFIGTVLRFGLNIFFPSTMNSKFPWSTFLSNIIGCLILGIVSELATKYSLLRPDIDIFLTIGLCGGFTTFSTLVYEGFQLLRNGNPTMFMLYGFVSFFCGYLFLYAGMFITRKIL